MRKYIIDNTVLADGTTPFVDYALNYISDLGGTSAAVSADGSNNLRCAMQRAGTPTIGQVMCRTAQRLADPTNQIVPGATYYYMLRGFCTATCDLSIIQNDNSTQRVLAAAAFASGTDRRIYGSFVAAAGDGPRPCLAMVATVASAQTSGIFAAQLWQEYPNPS